MCRSKTLPTAYSRPRINELRKEESTDESSPDEDEQFIGEITKSTAENVLITNLKVNDKLVKFKIDTGAQCNVLPEEIFDRIKKKPKLIATRTKLTAYGGTQVPVKGKCVLEVEKTADRKMKAEFFIVKAPNAKALIGLQTCQNLELININQVNEVQEKKTDIIEEYEDVFVGLGLVEGEYHIDLQENAKPTIQPPRKVPLSLIPKLKETLDNLTKSGVVSKLDRPTDWVNNLVIVEKKDGSLRLCLDPKDLNNSIKRGHYKAPSAEAISNHLSGKKLFTVIDMSNCYWHKKLDEESSYLCAFNTPFGRYKFNCMPFGICSASDVAQQMVDDEFSDIPGALAVHDDIIVCGANEEEHDTALEKVLQRARERNIKFNKKKIQLRVTEVKYLGNIVSEKGFTPDPEKIRAIMEMPPPESKQDLRRLLGMVNYLSQYIPNMSEITAPLRSLLKKDIQLSWHNEHQESLEKIQKILTSSPVLNFYDINKPILLQVDASQGGLGACLLQDGHPVIYASRSLTVAEQHYAQIEKELLAIVFACERFNQFIYGKQITVQSDHKPLEAIIAKPLSQAPPRIQRLLIRLQKYQPTVKYIPGKFLFIADTLSRAYLPAKGEQQELTEDIEVMIHNMVTEIPASPEKIEELKKQTAKDEILQEVKKLMIQGWPNYKNEVPLNVATYWNIRHELNEAEGLIFKANQLVIPTAMRPDMLNLIHESHLGIEKCKSRARAALFWPGMSNDIYEKVSKCATCAKFKMSNQKEPMIAHEVPERPWQKLGTDLCEIQGKNYLVVVDYYSKFIETALLSNKTAGTVIKHLKSIFARHGIPEELVSDYMPFNSKEFHEFAKEWGFKQTTSSPTYAQSNGMSEKAVQTVKRILKKADDPYIGLMEYRNTPVTGMTYSPSQLLMSRIARTKIPISKELLLPEEPSEAKQQLAQRQKRQKLNYDKSTKPLPPLENGDSVHLRQDNIWVPATVTGLASSPRSYIVMTPDGQQYRRNRRHLLKTNIPPPIIIDQSENYDEDDHPSNPLPQPHQEPSEPQNARRSTRRTVAPMKYQDYVMK